MSYTLNKLVKLYQTSKNAKLQINFNEEGFDFILIAEDYYMTTDNAIVVRYATEKRVEFSDVDKAIEYISKRRYLW